MLLAVLLPAAALATASSCGGNASGTGLRPEPVEVSADPPPARPRPPDPPLPAPVATSLPPAGSEDPGNELVAAVAGALARYDLALTELSSDPQAVLDPAHPARARLASTIAPGSALLGDLLSDTAARLSRGSIVLPGDGGLSWTHHPVEVREVGPGRLSFTWCGWSPGTVVDAASGATVDDAVGISTGTGAAIEAEATWVLASLDQTELRTEPPGTPNPCPAAGAVP